MSLSHFIEKEGQRLKRESVSRDIADRLEEGGIPAYRKDVELSLVGIVSGETRSLTSYRNINFIEEVAKRNRSRHVQFLEYSLSRHPKRYRMFVLNTGERVEIPDIREMSKSLHRNLSRIAKEMRDLWNVDLVFRSTEYGSMRKRGGEPTFHPHAHCLVNTPHMGSDQYGKFIEWMNKRWRSLNNMSPDQSWNPFNDSGKIRNVREVCKYMVKCSDLLGLETSQLVEFYRQTRKLQLVQFLGSLKEERRLIKDQGIRPVRIMKNEKEEWRMVKNWNVPSEQKKNAIKEAKALKEIHGIEPRASSDVVLALTAPSFHFSHEICEPAVLVNKYTGHFHSLRSGNSEVGYMSGVCRLVLEVRPPVDALQFHDDPWMSPSNVHNDTITVGRNRGKRERGREPPKIPAEIPF